MKCLGMCESFCTQCSAAYLENRSIKRNMDGFIAEIAGTLNKSR